MWPFSSKDDEVREMKECQHPDWEYETVELLYPQTVYSEDGELFVRRAIVQRRSCTECNYTEAHESKEEKVYLDIDRIEEVEEDA